MLGSFTKELREISVVLSKTGQNHTLFYPWGRHSFLGITYVRAKGEFYRGRGGIQGSFSSGKSRALEFSVITEV